MKIIEKALGAAIIIIGIIFLAHLAIMALISRFFAKPIVILSSFCLLLIYVSHKTGRLNDILSMPPELIGLLIVMVAVIAIAIHLLKDPKSAG